jgi:hypothetical protein
MLHIPWQLIQQLPNCLADSLRCPNKLHLQRCTIGPAPVRQAGAPGVFIWPPCPLNKHRFLHCHWKLHHIMWPNLRCLQRVPVLLHKHCLQTPQDQRHRGRHSVEGSLRHCTPSCGSPPASKRCCTSGKGWHLCWQCTGIVRFDCHRQRPQCPPFPLAMSVVELSFHVVLPSCNRLKVTIVI